MPENEATRSPGTGLKRWLLRAPIGLYRARLGWLLGNRFLLLNHLGRKSGKWRQAVLEVAGHDPAKETYLVAAGFGPRSDWYRNLKAHPDVTIEVGRRHCRMRAELLSPPESGEAFVDYARRHPRAARNLARLLGYVADGSSAGYFALGHDLVPFVRFHPRP